MSNIEMWKKKPQQLQVLKLGWDTWNEVCDFVSVRQQFGGGVYLNPETFEVLPEGSTSEIMGLRLHTPAGIVIARQGDYLVKESDEFVHARSPETFLKNYEKWE